MLLVGVLALALGTATASAAPAFTARGSVEQVYVTGARPGRAARARQRRRQDGRHARGQLARRAAVPQRAAGQRLPRAAGLRRGGLRAAHRASTQPAPPSTGVYNQSIPADGYGYLTTRDGTQLAINVHPPQDVADAVPLPDGVELPPLPAGPTRR